MLEDLKFIRHSTKNIRFSNNIRILLPFGVQIGPIVDFLEPSMLELEGIFDFPNFRGKKEKSTGKKDFRKSDIRSNSNIEREPYSYIIRKLSNRLRIFKYRT